MADEFDDDIDLDDLPADALDEIEERAIASTQQHQARFPDDFGATEDDDVIDLNYHGQAQPRLHFAQPQPIHQQDEVSAREQWRQQRYGGASAQRASQTHDDWHNVTYSQVPQAGPGQPTAQNGTNQQNHIDVVALQARIAELEQQQALVQKTAEDARAAYLSKAGEISIVRANHDKTSKEYERRLAVMQQLHSEEVARQRAELDRIKRDRDKVETDNRFLQHDLAQEAEKAKSMKRTLAVRPGTSSKPAKEATQITTPKKDKTLATFRDGFDDDEIVVVSPSKARDKMKVVTPKRAKRKRTATQEPDNSPGILLPLVMDDSPIRAVQREIVTPPRPTLADQPASIESTKKFETMQMILNHRADGRTKRTMELLATLFLPAAGSVSISTSISDDLARLPLKQSDDDFRYSFSTILMNHWSECIKQKYYEPIATIANLLTYLLLDSDEVLSTSLTAQLTPLCLTTTDLICIPAIVFCKTSDPKDAPSKSSQELINPTDYLGLLHLTAFNCLSNDDDLASLWSLIAFDFVLAMLNKAQPIPNIMQMLQLLSTSILPNTFGTVVVVRDDEQSSVSSLERQARCESHLIHRLIFLLFEPATSEGVLAGGTNNQMIPSSSTALPSMRTQVLSLLTELVHTPHGGQVLATHPLAFGRLVRFLHHAILNLYNYCPEPVLAADEAVVKATPSAHDHYTAHINLTVLLLAQVTDVPIVTTDSTTTTRLNVRGKLAAVAGGAEHHLVSLSRIAFADGLTLIEKGILPETADAAHRMLDELLSPEEGEAVMVVFGGSG